MPDPQVSLLIEHIESARRYTTRLLDPIDPADWFRMPSDLTNVAWQVGHLAFAQYRLAMERVRGVRPEDASLIPESFLRQFARGTTPNPDPAANPPIAELRSVFDRVHAQAIAETSALS